MTGFPAQTFKLLEGLAKDNTKAWFEAHRPLYDKGYVEALTGFCTALGERLRDIYPEVWFEPKIGQSLSRINRDIRFSKDKRPYKEHLDLFLWHGSEKSWSKPGFWFRLSADKVMLGCGLHGMDGPVLDRYRRAVTGPRSAKDLLAAIAEVKAAGPHEIGEKTRKQFPRGVEPEGPAAEYLLYDSLHAGIDLPPRDALSDDFDAVCARHYAACWPVAQWLIDYVADDPQ